MMGVWKVRMSVADGLVSMPVCMRCITFDVPVMTMPVMLVIMTMGVLVLQGLMSMFMHMLFAEMEPYP